MDQIKEYKIDFHHEGYEEPSVRYFQAYSSKEARKNFEGCHPGDDVSIDGIYVYDRFRDKWFDSDQLEEE